MNASILEKYEFYLRSEKCMQERSVKDYLQAAKDIASVLDIEGSLTYKDVNDLIRSKKETQGLSQASIYKLSICVRHLFRWLQREQIRPDNPYPFAEWKKPRPATPKFLTQEQFLSITDDPGLSHQEMSLLFILWDSGARIGEIEQLIQSNIDTVKAMVNIPWEISKGHYSHRNVPLTRRCADLLAVQIGYVQRRGHMKAIFINAQNEPMTRSGMQKVIAAIGLRQSPIRPLMRLSPHQFRHSFGIRMLEKGVPETIVQKWLGHQSLSMTSWYINMGEDSSRRIFDMYVEKECLQKIS